MGKRFVRTGDADRRAVKLYLQLREIETLLPLVGVRICDDGKTIKIFNAENPMYQSDRTVDYILGLNPKLAKDNGGDLAALNRTYQKPRPQVSSKEVAMGTHKFLAGEDD